MKCIHKFKVLREGKNPGWSSDSMAAILQCEKCLGMFKLPMGGNKAEEIKDFVKGEKDE